MSEIRTSIGETADDPMLIDWGHNAVARVVDIREENGSTILVAAPFNAFLPTVSAGQDDQGLRLPTLGDAVRALGDRNVLKVMTAEGRTQTIIGWAVQRASLGYGRGVWNALVSSGPR